ncbi:MAG: LVIVD repeat-containing protein [Actinomycetota bacterium]
MGRSRLAVVAAIIVVAFSTFAAHAGTDPANDFSPTPDAACLGANDHPESVQGRVPWEDFNPSPGYPNGRAALGYTCNATQVSHVGSAQGGTGGSGGYRVFRYTDSADHTCVFYDTTLLFPVNAKAALPDPNNPTTTPGGTGVWVMNFDDPTHPVHTATLSTPAMQSPHESFSINYAQGLLGAVFGNPAFYHGQFDLYSIKNDCQHPTLDSTLPMGVLGHEGSFSPDGNTYYAASLYGHTLTAIDTSNPLATRIVWTSTNWNVHGLNMSDDGNLMYFADLARNGAPDQLGDLTGTATKGMTVLDVSEIQNRGALSTNSNLLPQARFVSHITWPHVGTPQTDLPISVNGHKYLVEVDEFGGTDNVGAARIINVDDEYRPYVVSNMRLAVNNTQADPDQVKDPNATNSLAGYRGHYCQVNSKIDPTIVACSFILSGLRVFNISDLLHPVEIAYFNMPSTVPQTGASNPTYGAQGSYAMSQPAFDNARHQIIYSDGNSGLYTVQINSPYWP